MKSLFKFAASGLISSAVTLGLTAGLHELGSVPETVSAALGLLAAFSVNFFVLRYFVFGVAGSLTRQLVSFAASSGFFRLAEYAAFLGLHALHVNYVLALVLVLAVSFFAKFAVSRVIFGGLGFGSVARFVLAGLAVVLLLVVGLMVHFFQRGAAPSAW